MLAIRFDDAEIEKGLSELAIAIGHSKDYHAKKALEAYLEDCADYLLAVAALEGNEPRTPLADVRKELGLER